MAHLIQIQVYWTTKGSKSLTVARNIQ